MGRIILFIIVNCLITTNTFAQTLPTEKVVEVNFDKKTLFNNAFSWATTNGVGLSKTILTNNYELGTIIIKIKTTEPNILLHLSSEYRYSVNIDCKDGKYRYIINNPTIVVKPNIPNNLNYFPTNALNSMRSQAEAALEISTTYFGNKQEWDITKLSDVKSEDENIKKYEEQLLELGDSRKDRKEKDVINYKLDVAKAKKQIVSNINSSFFVLLYRMEQDLSQAMLRNNDF